MNYVSKSIFVTLMLTLALAATFGQKEVELRLDSGGKLVEPETPEAGWLGGVLWVIKKGEKIKSFKIEEESGNTRYIFTKSLPKVEDTSLHMKINFHLKGCLWQYRIIWTGMAGEPHTYDPKIAVKPLVGSIDLLLLLGFIVTSITSIMFSSKLRNAKLKIVVLEKKVNELAKNGSQNT